MAVPKVRMPKLIHIASALFCGGLIAFSLLCSVLFLVERLDRPHWQTIYAEQQRAPLLPSRPENGNQRDGAPVHEVRVIGFLQLVETVSGLKFEPLHFVFLFSLLLAGLIEGGILLIVGALCSVMVCAVSQTRPLYEPTGASCGDTEIDKVARRAERTLAEAEELYQLYQAKTDQ